MKQVQIWIEAQGRTSRNLPQQLLLSACRICRYECLIEASSHQPVSICEHYTGLAQDAHTQRLFLKFARILRSPDKHLQQLPSLPVPAVLLEALEFDLRDGYRYVGLYWEPAGDEFMITDGLHTSQGNWHIWDTYIHHPAVRPHVADFEFGSSDAPAKHMLVLDSAQLEAYAGDFQLAKATLIDQQFLTGPNPLILTLADLRQEAEAFREQLRILRGALNPKSLSAVAYEIDEADITATLRRQNKLELRLVQELNRYLTRHAT